MQQAPISHYGSITSLLGKGTYGKVYSTNQGYAIKLIKRPDRYLTTETLNEILYPPSLAHPNIIRYYDIYLEKKYVAIIMDRALADLSNFPMAGNSVMFIDAARQLINGVAYLTSRGIIHRDIKPQNILVFQDAVGYRYRLTDFGLAVGRESLRPITDLDVYTLPYRAPEIIVDEIYTSKADVWALGCTLYEIYTGRRLFRGMTPDEVLDNIHRRIESIGRPLVRNPVINNLFRKMIHSDPDRRSNIVDLQQHSLFKQFPVENVVSTTFSRFDYATWVGQLKISMALIQKTVDWLRQIQAEFCQCHLSYNLGVEIFYRYLPICFGAEPTFEECQLVAMAALYLGVTWLEPTYPEITDYVQVIDDASDIKDFIRQVDQILSSLNFNLDFLTAADRMAYVRSKYTDEIMTTASTILIYVMSIPELYWNSKTVDYCIALAQNDHTYSDSADYLQTLQECYRDVPLDGLIRDILLL